ncbi:ATP11-domain-containing protein, partial [Atractiella rhizophila]
PPLSTVLFTPLAAYRSQNDFAQPHLILTHYTDLEASHDIVLMRGEITAGQSGTGTLLAPTDAMRLVLQLQQFYWAEGKEDDEKRQLLVRFHEAPEQFDIEKLIELGKSQEI